MASRPFGFLIVDKPQGLTSHDVVAKIRRLAKEKKVGHAGTLDPMATGILVVCMGLATRLSDFAMHSNKRYLATVRLGAETDTYDAEGAITAEYPLDSITCESVSDCLSQFVGDIQQVPPMYSAIKVGGKKLYEMAREGNSIEREPRNVTIHELTIARCELPEVELDVLCGSGTYIRSLAYDLGRVAGVGGHLIALRRVTSGAFTIEDAVSLDTLTSDNWRDYLIEPDRVLLGFPKADLTSELTQDIEQGRPITLEDFQGLDGQLARAYDADGYFFALLKSDGQLWRPYKVFHKSQ